MQLITTIAALLLRLIEVLLFLRAILSWFPLRADSPVIQFVTVTTEPLLMPVRMLLYRVFPGLRRFPFDISFIIVFILIQLLISLL
ncbi:MAG: YggT family protein [Clostridiaceae bacterium]|nr:YggT family protein [Clostridiaceae bacterium]